MINIGRFFEIGECGGQSRETIWDFLAAINLPCSSLLLLLFFFSCSVIVTESAVRGALSAAMFIRPISNTDHRRSVSFQARDKVGGGGGREMQRESYPQRVSMTTHYPRPHNYRGPSFARHWQLLPFVFTLCVLPTLKFFLSPTFLPEYWVIRLTRSIPIFPFYYISTLVLESTIVNFVQNRNKRISTLELYRKLDRNLQRRSLKSSLKFPS